MDAIESVRINRLFDGVGTRQPSNQRQQPISMQQIISTQHPQQQSPQQKHHLALDPTDTSQGAVHTFQDDQGNWYTYWFGEQSMPFYNGKLHQ